MKSNKHMKFANTEMVQALLRPSGVFHKETKHYRNRADRKGSKQSLLKLYR
jgi:hypothetical protein